MSVDPDAFIHSLAFVCGDVVIGARASIWPFAVVRGDSDRITIGVETSVQDGCVIHADPGVPCTLGARVVVGHRAIVHGATVHDDVLIGMGAVVLNRAVIGAGSIIGAGSVVTEGVVIPPNSLVLGAPGRVKRETTESDRAATRRAAGAYVRLQQMHANGAMPQRRSEPSIPRIAGA